MATTPERFRAREGFDAQAALRIFLWRRIKLATTKSWRLFHSQQYRTWPTRGICFNVSEPVESLEACIMVCTYIVTAKPQMSFYRQSVWLRHPGNTRRFVSGSVSGFEY